MAVLIWKHGKSKTDALAAIQAELEEHGYSDSVKWEGAKAKASFGPLGSIIRVKGEVTDDVVRLEKCSGLARKVVLKGCRKMLKRLFPGGEQLDGQEKEED